jgi:glycosyltransferase involved in cell wall biosynthesis
MAAWGLERSLPVRFKEQRVPKADLIEQQIRGNGGLTNFEPHRAALTFHPPTHIVARVRRTIVFSNYDSPGNPYYGGGGARAIHEVARRLAERHAVRVITGSYPGSREELVEGVSYGRLGGAWAGPKLGQLLYQFLLPRRVRGERFDLWVESLTPPFSTACLQWFTRKPVIALTQILAGRAMSRKYHLPFGTLERHGLKTYRYAIALSGHLKQELERANPSLRVAVIPNGVNRELIEQEVEPGRAHVLFLGRLDVEQKGIDLLLEAWSAIAATMPAPLVIAGGGAAADTAFVARRIEELRLGASVRAVGRVEGDQKDRLLRQAMFLVMPSRFEASPVVLLEALCYRLPVVLFGIPELLELPDACCVKVRPFDTRAYGQAALELARDTPRRLAAGAAAKQLARLFDWDDLARKYEEFFETVLQSG